MSRAIENDVAQLAYSLLYDEIGKDYLLKVTYSRRFKPYNANVRKRGREVTFSLSHSWRTVSPEIVIGLIQAPFYLHVPHQMFTVLAAAALAVRLQQRPSIARPRGPGGRRRPDPSRLDDDRRFVQR